MPSEWVRDIVWKATSNVEIQTDLEGSLRLTGRAEGFGSVTGELGRAIATFPVWVQPAGLAEVRFSTDTLIMSSSDDRNFVGIQMFDTAGVQMSPTRFRVSFAVTDTTLAYPSPRYVRPDTVRVVGNADSNPTGRVEGSTWLLSRVGTRVDSLPIVVTAEPIGPTVAPALAVGSATGVRVAWPFQRTATRGYRVTRAGSTGAEWVEVGRPSRMDTVQVDEGLTPGAGYRYRVQACNEFGCAVRPSPEAAITLPPVAGSSLGPGTHR